MAEESHQTEESGARQILTRPISAWERFKKHKVAQWTLAYVAAAYATLDGTKIVSEAFDWPHQVIRIVTVLLILGLPLVVTLSWFHGHRALDRVSGRELTIITVLLALAGGVLWRFARAPEVVTANLAATPPAVGVGAAFSPPPHSIAVLPFVNMSGDKEQEYFSEGLTEEILNSLARLNELQVAARTSSFSFQGEHPDIATVAHKLNVGAVLEGSVRRAGNTVRITTQLVNGVTGFHLWSETYDRDLKDVLKLQTEIANAVASALKIALLGDVAAKIELGGTRNPAAFDAYLQGRKAYIRYGDKDMQDAIAAYTDAIRLDSHYALALAERSIARNLYAFHFATGTAVREFHDKALQDAKAALALAPELAEAHLALAMYFEGTLDFAHASASYDRARMLAPGNAEVLRFSGLFASLMGRSETGTTTLRRAVALDPLNPLSHRALSLGLYFSRRYPDAVTAASDAISLDADILTAHSLRGIAYLELGDFERARVSCEAKSDDPDNYECLAIVYHKLGRHPDAETAFEKLRAADGEDGSLIYATVYAQWGNSPKALKLLDAAMRLRDPGLETLKTDPLMDPLRKEPRFQAMMREMKFPD